MTTMHPTPEAANPDGQCQCGCGRPAPLATHTKTDQGIKRGQPVRFISGHQFRRHVEDLKAAAQEREAAKGLLRCAPARVANP